MRGIWSVPHVPFERYADDGVVHCLTEKQAKYVRDAIARRLALCKLELHPEKTRIVYCLRSSRKQAWWWWEQVRKRAPKLFAHWALSQGSSSRVMGAG
jgi:Reverse transcriptase (RNA-dependent DNA polymerase)